MRGRSWDITRLRTNQKWVYLYLYVVMDIYSRAVVGWMVATSETAELASRLIEETCAKQGVTPGTLVLHADRGTQMTSKTLAQLLSDLEVVNSHSRPQVSNDNPFSESQFKTMKYHSSFPGKFATLDDATTFCRADRATAGRQRPARLRRDRRDVRQLLDCRRPRLCDDP